MLSKNYTTLSIIISQERMSTEGDYFEYFEENYHVIPAPHCNFSPFHMQMTELIMYVNIWSTSSIIDGAQSYTMTIFIPWSGCSSPEIISAITPYYVSPEKPPITLSSCWAHSPQW